MMGKNKIKICSDPYKKHIDYYWYNNEQNEWENMADMDNAPLNADNYISVSISHKAYDIYSEIIEKIYNQSGIEIVFEGTEDDYADMISVKDIYFSEYDIEIKRGEKMMMAAKDVMPQIEKSYETLSDFFKEYPDKETEAILNKYYETVKPEIAICVMGLYSSGKSAFINSLIGKEILPSASDPATAKIYKIRASEKSSISFKYRDKEYQIEFEGENWKVNKASNNEIVKRIKQIIEEKTPTTEEQYIYWTLHALNTYAKEEGERRHGELIKCANEKFADSDASNDEKIETLLKQYQIKELVEQGEIQKNQLDDVIEIHVQFEHSYLPLDRFGFVIYDTPGTNSVLFREHADILRESLRQQTNGLPIFVTTPDSMDGTDNQAIISNINKLGEAMDLSNMLIVVNKSDEKSSETLKAKVKNQDKLFVTRWKANRAYFVSSVIGLGGKKSNPSNKTMWNDTDYYRTFYKNKGQFEDQNDPFYMRLFEYNILPTDVKTQLGERVEKIEQDELLLWNSGIPCVEEAIGQFAEKYALYNKCSQAIGYLTEATSRVKEAIKEAQDNAKKLSDDIDRKMDAKKRKLSDKLDGECDSEMSEFQSSYRCKILPVVEEKYIDTVRIEQIISECYENCMGTRDVDKIELLKEKLDKKIKEDVEKYAIEVTQKTEQFWISSADKLRKSLMKIVKESEALSQQEKDVLESVLLNVVRTSGWHGKFDITETEAIERKRFLGFLWVVESWTKVNINKTQELYREFLKKEIIDNNDNAWERNEKNLTDWVKSLKDKLKEVVVRFNPELISLQEELDMHRQTIDEKLRQDEVVHEEIGKIKSLLIFREE